MVLSKGLAILGGGLFFSTVAARWITDRSRIRCACSVRDSREALPGQDVDRTVAPAVDKFSACVGSAARIEPRAGLMSVLDVD